ncbi:MAG: hypothetical protein ACAH12_10415 [Methylophilaceae bacterium]
MARLLRFIAWYIALTFVAGLILLVFAFPKHPETLRGWLIFFSLTLPVTLLGELIGEGVWRNPAAKVIEEKSAGQEFSWLRIAYGFIAMLIVFGLFWGLAIFLGINK